MKCKPSLPRRMDTHSPANTFPSLWMSHGEGKAQEPIGREMGVFLLVITCNFSCSINLYQPRKPVMGVCWPGSFLPWVMAEATAAILLLLAGYCPFYWPFISSGVRSYWRFSFLGRVSLCCKGFMCSVGYLQISLGSPHWMPVAIVSVWWPKMFPCITPPPCKTAPS